eukprot:1145806-Pelagomonas_calceolata.AAC.4
MRTIAVLFCFQEHYRLDALLTVVDAKHVIQHLDEEKPEGVENEVRATSRLIRHPAAYLLALVVHCVMLLFVALGHLQRIPSSWVMLGHQCSLHSELTQPTSSSSSKDFQTCIESHLLLRTFFIPFNKKRIGQQEEDLAKKLAIEQIAFADKVRNESPGCFRLQGKIMLAFVNPSDH